MMNFVGAPRAPKLSLIGGSGHYEAVISAVLDARVSVWIATANLKGLMVEDARLQPGRARTKKRWRSVLAGLDELAEREVELRILHGGFPSQAFRDEFDRYPRLLERLAMRACPRVHLKAIIVDGARMYLGSANWTGAGLGAKGETRRNFELGIWTEDESLLDEVQAMFEHLWRGSECRGCGRRDVCDAPIADHPDLRARDSKDDLVSRRSVPSPRRTSCPPRRRGSRRGPRRSNGP
jgi:phosphatidylserine/phosphatidylglycerophosphate/cardiolipin synthase-like enzyme